PGTWFVRDVKTGSLAVIKSISVSTLTEAAKRRLEHEQAVFQHAAREFLAPLKEIGRSRDHWYCVRDFVAGRPLGEQLKESRLTVAETLAVARCLLRAIQNLHAQYVLHGNVKPSNLILHRADSDWTATLVDGGCWDH